MTDNSIAVIVIRYEYLVACYLMVNYCNFSTVAEKHRWYRSPSMLRSSANPASWSCFSLSRCGTLKLVTWSQGCWWHVPFIHLLGKLQRFTWYIFHVWETDTSFLLRTFPRSAHECSTAYKELAHKVTCNLAARTLINDFSNNLMAVIPLNNIDTPVWPSKLPNPAGHSIYGMYGSRIPSGQSRSIRSTERRFCTDRCGALLQTPQSRGLLQWSGMVLV